MGQLKLTGDLAKKARKGLQGSFRKVELESLVSGAYRPLVDEINWAAPKADVAFRVVETAELHGVLDRILAAAVAERPFVDSLRATAMHLSTRSGWTAPLESHGLDVAGGLEALTSGGDPFLDTTLLARWLIRAERQVCRVRCGGDLGTGFLIGPDLVLTCYHVVMRHLGGSVPASKVGVLFDYRRKPTGIDPVEDPKAWIGIDPDWKIPWSAYADHDVTLAGPEPTDEELDYAVLRLRTAPGSEAPEGEDPRGWEDLSEDRPLPPEDDPILIVQHPGIPGAKPLAQHPLKISFATPGFRGLIAAGTRVRYHPSTLKGSSGSPAYDRSFSAVALHHNRGQIDPTAKDRTKDNRGIPLDKIRAHLAKHHQPVFGALQPPPT